MKQAVILHGASADHTSNWFPWLKEQLEANGYQVWVPDLPGAEKPSLRRFVEFLKQNYPFDLNDEVTLIGHSVGAVAILSWLQSLPQETRVGNCYLVAAFIDDLGCEMMKDFFNPQLEFSKIKGKAEKLNFIYSDDDPFIATKDVEFLSGQVDGELHLIKGQKHFAIDPGGPQYKEFPFLLDLILKNEPGN